MAKRRLSTKKQVQFASAVIITVILFFVQYFNGEEPLQKHTPNPQAERFEDVKILSVYDGDTFKIDLNCDEEVLCKNISVRVRGIDCPEIKGKTAKEKRIAKKARSFTQNFLSTGPVNLENCGRDKYFRLLCEVKTGQRDLARELLQAGLAYPYDGGTKEDFFQ